MQLLALALTTDDRGRRDRQVRTGSQTPQRRKLSVKTGCRELVEVLRLGHVLEAVPPQVDEGHPFQRLGGGDPVRRLREHHLTAVRARGDPGRAVHVHPDVAVLVPRRLTGVQAHPHAHRHILGPGLAAQLGLCLHGRVHRVADRREDDEEAVALRPHLPAPPPLERGPQDRPLRGQHLGVPLTQPAQQARRGLDVAEQQRQGPGRER